jgi:hypothetical protein
MIEWFANSEDACASTSKLSASRAASGPVKRTSSCPVDRVSDARIWPQRAIVAPPHAHPSSRAHRHRPHPLP